MGTVVRVIGSGSTTAGVNTEWEPVPLRAVILRSSVVRLSRLSRNGAVLEEEQFLKDH